MAILCLSDRRGKQTLDDDFYGRKPDENTLLDELMMI